MGQQPLIVFLHIPKTAGLTVRTSVLPRQYRAHEIFSGAWAGMTQADGSARAGVFSPEFQSFGLFAGVRGIDSIWFPESVRAAAARFSRLPPEQRAQVRLFHGEHIEFGVHHYLSQPVSYFTLLREPVARVLSHYCHGTRRHVPEGMRLREHVSALVEPNLQTRLLAGPHEQTAALQPHEMLERATRNLDSFAVVGLTERFDETMLLLRRAFGWRMPFYERRNVSRHRLRRETIPAEEFDTIRAVNSLDMELYAHAQMLFEAQIQRYGAARMAMNLRVFRLLNWGWKRWQSTQPRFHGIRETVNRRVVDPAYGALARWGGLRRLRPASLTPRVVRSVENDRLYFDLWMGTRVVGRYDFAAQRWEIRRPYHLLVDEKTLPGVK